jgi:dsRNA-specific ribonuclease
MLTTILTQQPHNSQFLTASTVEAILGAVWFDSNNDIKKVEQVIEALHLTAACKIGFRFLQIISAWSFLQALGADFT